MSLTGNARSSLPQMSIVGASMTEVEQTFGMVFLGYCISTIAYGFTYFQVYTYFQRFPNDGWPLKATVAALGLLDTAASALVSHAMYVHLISCYPSLVRLDYATPTWAAALAISSTSIFVVQIFYCFRIRRFSNLKPLMMVSFLAAAGGFGLNLAVAINIGITQSKLEFLRQPTTKALLHAGTGLVAVAAAIAFAACFSTGNHKSTRSARVKQGSLWYQQAIVHAFSHLSMAAVVQAAFFVTLFLAPAVDLPYLWVPFQLFLPKLFVNSALAQLNWRKIRKGKGYNEGEAMPNDESHVPTSFSQGRSLGHVASGIVFDDKWDFRSELPMNLPVVGIRRDDEDGLHTHPLDLTLEEIEENGQHPVLDVVEYKDDSALHASRQQQSNPTTPC